MQQNRAKTGEIRLEKRKKKCWKNSVCCRVLYMPTCKTSGLIIGLGLTVTVQIWCQTDWTLNAPTGRTKKGWKEIEWGPRKISLSPTQARFQPLVPCLSDYSLRGAKFINIYANSSLTNVGRKHSLRVWNTHRLQQLYLRLNNVRSIYSLVIIWGC